ncbi:hypothetical protein B0H15DRAFT_94819 [Mycena belliarum]|uniref:F-box domain-containing protein n=1 Tax=Mycena belliarum TaxID=1033014 RepID=A0AAD6U8H3_9AGAR|nr:hypothetical protein B0H15DRAFT_94819 [Mycena belliae]
MSPYIYREFASPIRPFLHTNFVPTDTQHNEIRVFLDESLKNVREMDAEISRLGAQMAHLIEQRENMCNDIDAHQAMITPVRRLPRDILQEIFVACLPTDRNSVITPLDAPMLLGQICSPWRTIALTTPCLWSTLHVVIPGTAEKIARVSETIKVWLSRSGALPLSITVVLSRTFNDTISPSAIFATLSTFARRWNNIQFLFALASNSLMESLALLRTEDVPLLEQILVCSWVKDIPADTADSLVPLPFLDTPSLRGASINFFGHASPLPTEWNSITELHLNTGNRSGRSLGFMTADGGHMGATTYLSPQLALDVLRRCPNLTTVSLEITHEYSETAVLPSPDPSRFGPAITLSNLKYFSVSFAHRRPHDAFFNTLILPELEVFEFTGCVGKTRAPFFSLLKRSGALTELTLSLRRFRLSPILECLKITPDISKLKLSNLESPGWGRWFTDDNASAPQPHEELLTLLSNDTDLVCPRLTSVEFDGCTLFSDDGLLKFLKRRLGNEDGTVPLQKFGAVFSRQRELDVKTELKPFVGPGVTITLCYTPSYVPPPPQPYSPWEGIGPGPIPYFNHDNPWSNRYDY